MDYSFAPGTIRGRRVRTTPQDRRVRRMFQRRSNTTHINNARRRRTLRQFIQHLATHGSITRPVEDLLVGTHANSQGFIFIPMFPGQRGPTHFETLESTISTAARSIEIPDATIGHTAGDPITHDFHIKGCNIGQARPFLLKMKEALGDHVNVTAPKHFHYLYDNRRLGVIEGMGYEFTIMRTTPFANRAAVVTAFQTNVSFLLYDGSVIPTADWNTWLPARIRSLHLRRNRRLGRNVRVPLGQQIGTRTTVPFRIEFRVHRSRFRYTITYPNSGSVPSTTVDRQQALDQSLNSDPSFALTHDFPAYERWGYSTIADFLLGYSWRFARSGKRLVCTGRRYEYTLMPPIVDTSNGNFVFNFYPNAGSAHAAITTGLVETDTRLFETV